MLQTIRSKTAGAVVKALFIILVGSFAIWGIGDYTFLYHGEQPAIQIGDTKITSEQLSAEYRREVDRLRQSFGQFDLDLARQIGLINQVVDRIVRDTLFEKEAARLGIVVNDDVVRGRIVTNPAFQGPDGSFDPSAFQRVLYENGYDEGQYVRLLRQELARAAVIESVAAGSRAPDPLVDRLYRHRNERRIGEFVFVPNSSIDNVGEPDNTQLKSVYDGNPEQFTEPEHRALIVLRVGVEELMPTIQVSDQQIMEEYNSRLSEFRVPEKRDIEQMLFTDEEAAKAAAAKIAENTPFLDMARDLAKQTPEQTRLDGVTRSELLPELADAMFALPEGGVTAPVKSAFGWHIARVAKIHPSKGPTVDELKDQLRTDIARRMAADAAYDTAVKVEDEMGSGTSLAEAAAKVGLSVVEIPAVDAQGRTPKGEVEPMLAEAPEVLQTVFQTAQGQDTQLIETRTGAYFLAHVDSVTPQHVKPLDEVRPQVVALWKAEQQNIGARKHAEQIVERHAQGKTLAEAAAEFNLKPEMTPSILRDGSTQNGRAPSEVAAQLFAAKPGDTSVTPSHDGYYVVRLTEIRPADPSSDPEGMANLRTALARQIGGDLVSELATALRSRYEVNVDTQAVDRVL